MKFGSIKVVFLLIIFTISSCNNPESNTFKVLKIVDGDTFYIDDGTEKGISVRLIGVDTPETKHPRKPVEHYGKEATAFLTALIENKTVRLEYDIEKYDRYKRLLAYVYVDDSTFVNAKLVEEGYARIATFPPNVKHAELFLRLEQEARKFNRGLWAKEES